MSVARALIAIVAASFVALGAFMLIIQYVANL